MSNQTKKTLAVPYGKDNDFNLFGDYTSLELLLEREKETDPGSATWSLVGPPHIRRKELNPDEVNTACVNFFYQQAVEK